MNITTIAPSYSFKSTKKDKTAFNNIPVSKKPLLAYQSMHEIQPYGNFSSLGENIANSITSIKEGVINIKDNIYAKIAAQKLKMQRKIIDKKVKDLNKQHSILKNKQDTLTQEQLLHSINKIFKDAHLKIAPMNFKNVTNEELLNFFEQYIQYYSINGKDALINASITQARAENMREKVMADIMKELKKGADYYTTPKIREHLTASLVPIAPNKNLTNISQYIDEIKTTYITYRENSEKINNLLDAFRELSKNYFTEAGDKLQDTLNLKKDNLYRILERIPVIGIIPKGFRIHEQYSMIKTMLQDYAAVTECYLQNGANPVMVEYSKQYDIIIDYIKTVLPKFKKQENIQLLESMIDKINTAKEKKDMVYKNLVKIFLVKGTKLTKACKQIKTKEQIELALKLASSLLKC